MKLITLSGLDGSGKSTQIAMLKSYLENQGKRVFYFHAIQFGLANKLSGRKEAGTSKSNTEANIFQIYLRRFFLLIDILRFKRLYIKLATEKFDHILSDRYFYDTVINIKFLAKSAKDIPCEKLIAKPDVAIYLKVDPQLIMQRERKPDQGIAYLEKKKELYDRFAEKYDLEIVDGNRDKNIIFEELKSVCQI